MKLASQPPAAIEPRVHRRNVLGVRTACEQTWGKGAYEEAVEALPSHVRAATAGLLPLEEWIPEDFLIAWTEAVWRGPARQNEDTMRTYVAASIAHGFGRVRRFFLKMIAADTIASRAPGVWRQEHTTGDLSVEIVRANLARIRLADHPYVETPLMRLAIAESFRFIVSMTSAPNVTERHPQRGSPLVIDIGWDTPA